MNIALIQENAQAEQKIETALRHPKYAWRCAKHVAQETGLPESEVNETLERWARQHKVERRAVSGAQDVIMYGFRDRPA